MTKHREQDAVKTDGRFVADEQTVRAEAKARHERADATEASVERAHRKYGGFHIGAAFYGWLIAAAVGSLLTALLAAIGSAVALTTGTAANQITNNATNVTNTAKTVGLVSGILLLLALALAYYAGGYVAGRLARFDGARQGVGVWVFGLFVMIVLAAAGAMLGAKYNLLQALNLPRLPINEGNLTKGGLLTLLATLVVTLLAAISGGKVGEQYHHKIDRTARAAM